MIRDSIHIDAIDAFFEGCRLQGVDPADILAELGEPRSLLEDADARFPIGKVGRLVATISRTLQDETLGFLERPTDPGGLELCVQACISSKTLHEAIVRWHRFWRLLHKDFRFEIDLQGEEVKIAYTAERDSLLNAWSFTTWVFFLFVRWASWMIDKPLLLDRLNLSFSGPADAEDYRDMFPSRHYFRQQENSIVFNKRFLDMPVVQTADDVPDFVRIIPDLMTIRRVDDSLTGQIKRMLHQVDNIEALPLKAIAETLHKSPDTIRRHLKREGSSYAEIKESVRRDLAIYHLTRRDTPITRIAFMVGFSEPSAFNRAFKNWTGRTPGDYRKLAA